MEVERVQEIATLSNLKGTIPSEFIRVENEQPATTTLHGVKLEVPVMDFSQTDNESLADLISKASKRLGVIFKWVNPGDYPSEVISKLQNVGKDFLWYHKKEKEVIAKPNGYKGVEGYGTKLQKEVQGKKGWLQKAKGEYKSKTKSAKTIHTMEVEVERVQEIATLSNLKGTIPSEFIRLENEQPATTTLHGVKLEVPVIDLSQTDNADLISKASKDWGIFQVVNHGIPSEVISKLQKVGKEFFELPQEEKEVIAKPNGYKGVEGYGTKLQKEVQGKKGWVDHLFHVIWPPSAINYHFWPKNPPTYRHVVTPNYTSVLFFVTKLLQNSS
ncbi:flavonol synthase [Tanacetum coccineum]